jgi:hypothetical protein
MLTPISFPTQPTGQGCAKTLMDTLRGKNGLVVYVNLQRTSTTALWRKLVLHLAEIVPTNRDVIRRGVQKMSGRNGRVIMDVPDSERFLRPLFTFVEYCYCTIPACNELFSSLDADSGVRRSKFFYIGTVFIAAIAFSEDMCIKEQDAHRDNTKAGQELTLAASPLAIPLETQLESPKEDNTFLSADTPVFAFDGFHRHRGPRHLMPAGATYPYVAPGRLFFHFVSASKSMKEINALQDRDGMEVKSPVLFDFARSS